MKPLLFSNELLRLSEWLTGLFDTCGVVLSISRPNSGHRTMLLLMHTTTSCEPWYFERRAWIWKTTPKKNRIITLFFLKNIIERDQPSSFFFRRL
jgi:hypothetical protein